MTLIWISKLTKYYKVNKIFLQQYFGSKTTYLYMTDVPSKLYLVFVVANRQGPTSCVQDLDEELLEESCNTTVWSEYSFPFVL